MRSLKNVFLICEREDINYRYECLLHSTNNQIMQLSEQCYEKNSRLINAHLNNVSDQTLNQYSTEVKDDSSIVVKKST